MSENDIVQKLNAIAAEQSKIKKDVKSIKSDVGGLTIGTAALIVLGLSGIFGYQAGKGAMPDEHDQWSVVNKDTRIVKETVRTHYSGEMFDIKATTLSRTWDLNANQVCTDETRMGIYIVLPHYQYDETCRAITDSDKPSVDRAVQTLALSK